MTICVRCLVSGRVQGVFFRASTREQALTLGITGYVRNLADSRVEVMACGEREAIDQLRKWLTRGPSAAQVTGVSCEPQESLMYQNFTVR
ncbi:MAG: acylphosphatase [Gammaproteobacteria bacterium]|nr:acylphosphatase [Gammaproteobacteria bacterium]